MASPNRLSPVAAGERIHALDVLRGFALLGIFLMNIEFFARPLQDVGAEGIDSSLHGLDYAADALVYFFVQSKFWTLFSLLFGMGFGVMLARADAAGRAFVPVYLRRSLALLGIGLLHALLLWSGDILVSYAIAALLLLGLRQLRRGWSAWRRKPAPVEPMPAAGIAAAGLTCYGGLLVLLLLGGMLKAIMPVASTADAPPAQTQQLAQQQAQKEQAREAAVLAYRDGSYGEAVRQRARDTAMQLQQLPGFLPFLLGTFLTGMAIVRAGIPARPEAFAPQLRGMRNYGLPLGFGLMGLSVALGTTMETSDFSLGYAVQIVSYLAAGLLLALAYAATLLLALQGRCGPWLRDWLAPVGRMALSNYLLQSLVGSLAFYHYGLGLWGQVGRAQQVLLVLVVFALQVLLSRWWLRRFRFGPVEWLWRALTYLKAPPMRVGGA